VGPMREDEYVEYVSGKWPTGKWGQSPKP